MWIVEGAERKDDVLGGERLAVGKPDAVAQLQAIGDAVRKQIPTFRQLGLKAFGNPAHGQVRFALALDKSGPVRVSVFSAEGRRVAELYNGWLPEGTHALRWLGRDASANPAPPGVYMVQARVGSKVVVTRVVLVP